MEKIVHLGENFFKKFILFTSLTIIPCIAFSQVNHIPDRLSLDQAVRLFLKNNPNLTQSRAAARQTASQAYIPTLWPNPTLNVDQEQEDAGASQTFALDQPILNPVEYGARKKSAKYQKEAAQLVYTEDATQLYYQVRKKYTEAVSAQYRLQALQEITDAVRRAIKVLRVRRQEGAAGSFEVKRLSTALASYENRLAQARVQNKAARQDLILFIKPKADTAAATMDSTITLTDSLQYQPVTYEYKKLLQTAFQQRGLFASQKSFERAGKLSLRAEKAARFPALSITGSLNRKPGLQPEIYPFLGFSVEIPILNDNGPQIKAARAQYHDYQARVEIAKRQVELQVRTAFNQVQSYQHRIEKINGGILQKNHGMLKDALYLYSEGQLTLVGLLDAASAALDARLLHINLLTQYTLSRYQLEQAVGQLPPGFSSPDS